MHSYVRRRLNPVAGPRDHNELDRGDDVLPAMPSGDFLECVRADDEIQRAVGLRLHRGLHSLDRVDRITLRVAFFLARSFEPWIRRARELHHAIAIFIRRGGFLMRRMTGRNEQHAIQRIAIRGQPRHRQMGRVNRIERASENRRLHRRLHLHRHRRRHTSSRISSSSFSISIPILSQ